MDAFFAPPHGRLFQCFPGAEERPGQRRMAECVHEALQDGAARLAAWKRSGAVPEDAPGAVIQVVEAGTGTGKTLGYLIPALASDRRPVLVATRTKQLQRQLLQEDLPRATGILDRPVKAVLVKGRSNYLCRAAWEVLRGRSDLEIPREDFRLWEALQGWAGHTETGDREELSVAGEGESELWDRLNARSERCTGKACPHYEDCFLTRLRQKVAEADLVIANHALLLADRVLRESAFGQVLPDAPVLVLDEAHELEAQLTDSCSEVWSSRAMTLLLGDLAEAADREPEGAVVRARLDVWAEAWQTLVHTIPATDGVLALEDERLDLQAVTAALERWTEAGGHLQAELKRLGNRERRDDEDAPWMRLADRVSQAFQRMELIFTQPEGWISTLQREGPSIVIFKASPIDVRGLFDRHLRQGFETVVLTSATLRDGKGFRGLKLRLGLTDDELQRAEHVESPFDFPNQGLLFVPPDLPERRANRDGTSDRAWVEAALASMERLLRASGGRALLLFTSRRMLGDFKTRLQTALPDLTFFVQGERWSRHALLGHFKNTPRAVLLGLASFWQGVDLPGDVLSLVVVTALPFAPPDDPVLQARIQAADRIRPGLGFQGVQLPQMILKLKQGIGRLIRTRRDRGVVCILDPRLLLPHEDPKGKAYAAQVRAALPPFPICRDWDHVEAFLRRL